MMGNNNNSRPNILFVDDQPVGATLSQIIVPLRQKYHVEVAKKPQEAWKKLQSPPEHGWQMVMLDMQLDASMPAELQQYAKRLKDATTLDYSGQAIGLYLWAQRKAIQIPYAYISTFAHLWQPVQASDEGVEFAGVSESEKRQLVCNRGDQGDACEYIENILNIWTKHQWISIHPPPLQVCN